MNSIVEAALALARKGKQIFPCRPGAKEPLTPRGFKDATTDRIAIRNWWDKSPESNLALPTGKDSGLVVLDVDVDPKKAKDGTAELAELQRIYGRLPATLTSRTPRGGRHYFFKYPARGVRIQCSTDKLGKGLDVRADGGYVLVPPSRTERGEYRWESKNDPAELPPWLLDFLLGPTATHNSQNTSTKAILNRGRAEAQRVREALWCISASLPHDDWVRVLMALHTWDQIEGESLAREWSASCPEKFQERDFRTAWLSFNPNGGIGIGTLFEMARRHGWNPPQAGRIESNRARPAEQIHQDLAVAKWPDPPRTEAFYGIIGEFVRRLEPHTESDQMAVLVQMLAGFGNLIGRTAHFEVEADKHFGNLNAAIVGNSSKARKGTSWGHVCRILRKVDPSWPRHITGLSTGEGLIYCVRNPAMKTDRVSGEEIVDDEGVADKRLLAVETEFGRTLQCANREGNTLSAVVRQAFDSGDLHVAVKNSPQVATGAHISILGHITSIELNLLLTRSDTANGFANRFLWVAVRRSKLLPEGGNARDVNFSDVIAKLKEALAFARNAGRVSKDENAVICWAKLYQQLSHERPGLLGAVISRAEAIVMRMALIFAMADCSKCIRVPHLEAALAIWDYAEASAAFIFGDNLGNPLAERVLQVLQEAGENGLSLSGIYEALSGHVEKEELHFALRQLHSQGLAECQIVKTSGRPGKVWSATKAARERSEQSAKKEDQREVQQPTSEPNLSSPNSLNSPGEIWEETI